MEIVGLNRIYFLGIGGIGMSALARFLQKAGIKVAGYDKTPTEITDALIAEGINVHFDDNPELIPFEPELVIYTPAVPIDTNEFSFLESEEIPFMKRSEALGQISKDIFTIAVAGTHGKTTISSMITHILKSSGKAVTGFVGGICNNYNTNLILSDQSNVMVVEADEYDRSFLTLFPNIAIISAMDADHLDIYGDTDYLEQSFFLFSEQIKEGGTLILKSELEKSSRLKAKLLRYGTNEEDDIRAENIQIENGRNNFDLRINSILHKGFNIALPGTHNIENAIAAATACLGYGLDMSSIKLGLESYTGVKRRFEIRYNSKTAVYVDDYAHHPEEIKATIQAARILFPNRKILGIFQPHLFSRTRDLADGFAKSLSLFDELVLLDIYPAREKPIEGINSEWLLSQVKLDKKYLLKPDQVTDYIAKNRPEMVLTIGAGDIDKLVQPIEKTVKAL